MTEGEWHIMRHGSSEGPLSRSELQSRAQAGTLERADLVWQDGLPHWVQAGTIKGLFRVPPQAPNTPSIAEAFVNEPAAGNVDQVSNRRMISQLREDQADAQLLFPEIFRVAVRVNPVNIQIHNFLAFINQVTDATPRNEIARLIQEAMQQVDLTNASSMLDESLSGITTIGPEILKGCATLIPTVWPESTQYVRHRWLDDPVAEGENLRQQLCRAVQAHRQDLVVIQNHFRQLQEFLPRYLEIMNRSGVWDFLTGFAAAYFGGDIGVIGSRVWDDWRGMSDKDFTQSFGNAVEHFSTAALSFTQKTEQEVESVVGQFLKDLHDFSHDTISALECVADRIDLTGIYHKLHYPDPAIVLDDETKQFHELVLSNLSDQKVSLRSISNMREMLGV